nr:hypothetical protein [Tanacetum cinerariifolium]
MFLYVDVEEHELKDHKEPTNYKIALLDPKYDKWLEAMEVEMQSIKDNQPDVQHMPWFCPPSILMILESVEQGPLIWPTVDVEGVTRPKKYSELSAAEAIQADCDIKATNIILQGLPPEVYALVSTHKIAKELWERIQMLMQGTSLTKQERECKLTHKIAKELWERIQMLMQGTSLTKQERQCKLYDAFDKFAYQKGETLRDFYLRFSLLLNDMNMYNMKLEQFQVNTKFLNTLPSEWTSVEQNIIAYTQMDQQSSPEAGLVVPVFQKGDDPIDAINHMMSFLTSVVASRFPATKNQLRTSSNPRQQATINNGR